MTVALLMFSIGIGASWLGYNQSQQQVIITSPTTVSYTSQVTPFVSTLEITSPSIIARQDQLSGLGQSCLPVDPCSAPVATFSVTWSSVRYAVTISAGPVQISFTSVGGPVDFWILNGNQFGGWLYATRPSPSMNNEPSHSLNASLAAPSGFVKANVANFNGTVQIPATNDYYFIFANPNPQSVALKFEVNYPTVPVYQQTTIYQQPTSTVIQETIGEAPMGLGIVFYVGLLIVVTGIAILLVNFRKRTRLNLSSPSRRTNVMSEKKQFPNSVKIILACVLIILIVAGASLEYMRPQQSVTVTATAFVTQAPVTVTVTKTSPRLTGGLQFNGSISYSGVGKSRYVIVVHHPANVVVIYVVLSQKSLPSSVTSNGVAITPLASIATSSSTSSPFLLAGYISPSTQDNFTFTFPAGDAMLAAIMWFTGRGATTSVENYGVSAWTSVNPFSVTQGAGAISGRMNLYFAATWNDQPGSNPDIALDNQIIPVGGFRQSQNGSRQMTIRAGYIPDDNLAIITQYSPFNAGVGSVAFIGFDPS